MSLKSQVGMNAPADIEIFESPRMEIRFGALVKKKMKYIILCFFWREGCISFDENIKNLR